MHSRKKKKKAPLRISYLADLFLGLFFPKPWMKRRKENRVLVVALGNEVGI